MEQRAIGSVVPVTSPSASEARGIIYPADNGEERWTEGEDWNGSPSTDTSDRLWASVIAPPEATRCAQTAEMPEWPYICVCASECARQTRSRDTATVHFPRTSSRHTSTAEEISQESTSPLMEKQKEQFKKHRHQANTRAHSPTAEYSLSLSFSECLDWYWTVIHLSCWHFIMFSPLLSSFSLSLSGQFLTLGSWAETCSIEASRKYERILLLKSSVKSSVRIIIAFTALNKSIQIRCIMETCAFKRSWFTRHTSVFHNR